MNTEINELQTEHDTVEQEQPVEASASDAVDAGIGHAPESDLATDSDVEHEKNDDGINQQAVNAVINKKHAQAKQAERERDEALRKLQEMQAAQLEKSVPNIPELPDPLDDDYDIKLRQRDEAIQRRAQYDLERRIDEERQAQAKQEAENNRAAELGNLVNEYTNRAKQHGIGESELNAFGQTVVSYGLTEDHAMSILKDKDGALITKYLAENPSEIDKISNMSSYDFAIHIERNVRTNALKTKAKTPKAPAPAKTISGGGVDVDASQYPHLEGAKFL